MFSLPIFDVFHFRSWSQEEDQRNEWQHEWRLKVISKQGHNHRQISCKLSKNIMNWIKGIVHYNKQHYEPYTFKRK